MRDGFSINESTGPSRKRPNRQRREQMGLGAVAAAHPAGRWSSRRILQEVAMVQVACRLEEEVIMRCVRRLRDCECGAARSNWHSSSGYLHWNCSFGVPDAACGGVGLDVGNAVCAVCIDEHSNGMMWGVSDV